MTKKEYKEALKRLGITQLEFSKKIGITTQALAVQEKPPLYVKMILELMEENQRYKKFLDRSEN